MWNSNIVICGSLLALSDGRVAAPFRLGSHLRLLTSTLQQLPLHRTITTPSQHRVRHFLVTILEVVSRE